MGIWIGILLVLLVLACAFLTVMAKYAVRPQVHTLDYEKENLLKLEYMKDESIDIIEEHRVTTFDGQKLWAGFVPADKKSNYYVILSHGYTSTRYGMYKYVPLWRKLGVNCILYENRGHGANEPAVSSFGLRESKDLMAVIEDSYNRYGRDIHLGLHGESMGSGLQIMALAHRPKVDFIVNDCGYAAILPVLRWKVVDVFHFPAWLADLASPFAKLIYGFRFEEIRPIDHLKGNLVPICFVHGTNDTFIDKKHSQEMYDATEGYKELHLFEGAEHAECVVVDTKRYQEMLKNFVEKIYERKNEI